MKIMSKIYDQRINSWNLYVESTFREYLKFAKKIIENNELQRKRVKTSKTIYSLLRVICSEAVLCHLLFWHLLKLK